jgi:hypothetical protein
MAQQINLVNPDLRPRLELLTPAFLLRAVGVFALALALYAWKISHDGAVLAAQYAEWQQRAQEEQVKLLQAMQQHPPKTPSPALQEEIKSTQQKIDEREKVFVALKNGAIRSNAGFTGILQGFARQSVNGLWLTGIMANAAGDAMRISGKALSPDLIPQYLKRLSDDAALHGRTFTALEVTQPQPAAASGSQAGKDAAHAGSAGPGDQIEFVISSEPADTQAQAKKPETGASS